MARSSTSPHNHGPDHEVEKHLKTINHIEADLAKQYHNDFPEEYFRENFNMDRLFMMWHFRFEKPVADLLEHDLHTNHDRSIVCRYERAVNDDERQIILSEIKHELYT
jgi:hypothetical protein